MNLNNDILQFIDIIDGMVCLGLVDNDFMTRLYQNEFTIDFMGITIKIPWEAETVNSLLSYLKELNNIIENC